MDRTMHDCLQKFRDSLHPFCAESVMECIDALLQNPEGTDPEIWEEACTTLNQVAHATWWRCKCGEITPKDREIDAFCPQCGHFLQLPERLSRSPWPLYISCLQKRLPDAWFERLSQWMEQQGLGTVIEGDVLPQAIGAGGSDVLPQAIGAGGTAPHKRIIKCIDGMNIFESGEIRGLQWIALPMMTTFV